MMGDMFKKFTAIIAFLMTFATILDAQAQNCVSGRELIVHKTEKTFDQAQQACGDLGGSLLKVDNKEITDRINLELRPGEKLYYIGARWDGGSWKWRDGTNIGYKTWLPGEPDGKNEDCVAVGAVTQSSKGWLDIPCDREHFYMCQKEITKLALTVTSTSITLYHAVTKTVTCEEKTICLPSTVSWYIGSNPVTRSQTNSGVFQRKGNIQESAVLELRNVKIGHAGTYQCRATASGKQRHQRDVTVNVAGSPMIRGATAVACTSNIKVSWSPRPLALGYLHKLKAYPDSNHPRILRKTPRSPSQITTTFTNLLTSTKYTIQIVACKSSSVCPDTYVATHNTRITTGGIPNFVRDAKFQNEDGVCRISWQEPDVKGDPITGYAISLTRRIFSTRATNKTSEILVFNTTGTSHSFVLLPNRNYSATIRSVACGGESVPVHASGKCFGPILAPVGLKSPAVSIRCKEFLGDVTVQVPDEINGTMSCLFVVISNGTRVGIETGNQTEYTIDKLLMANSSMSANGNYIAVAIPVSRFAFKQQVTVTIGDNSTSSCNLFETAHVGNVNGSNFSTTTRENGTIFAQNKPLLRYGPYRTFIVAVVPSGRNLLLGRSPETQFSTHCVEPGQATTLQIDPFSDISQAELGEDIGLNTFQLEPISFSVGSCVFLLVGICLGALGWQLYQYHKNKKGTAKAKVDQQLKEDDGYEDVDRDLPGNNIHDASSSEFRDHNYSEITSSGAAAESAYEMYQC